ncbi:hypothetical protein AB0A05_26870 [Streptomyces sp. NPDC046374]|uniref:hypothetical protein n=1 Tax=Streptomyces sp. NPDC046374 TaxID=3154917 RepID=UPI0033FA1F3D
MTQTDLAMLSSAAEKRALQARGMARYDGPTSLTEMVQLAAILGRARGGMVPMVYYNNPDAVVAIFLACRALDVSVWTGLHELYQVKGSVSKKAILVRGLWLRHGVDYEFEATDTECTGWIKRPWDDKPITGEYTLMDAQRLGLIERNPEWEKQPKPMLRARWTTMMATMWTPNIMLGMNLSELSSDPAEDEGGWTTENTIGPEALRVLEQAGLAVKKGEGVEGLRRVWESNLVLLDAWAGEGESLRQVLTRMITEESVKGLPTEGRMHPGDAGRPEAEPRIITGETVEQHDQEKRPEPPAAVAPEAGEPAGGEGMWGPEESALLAGARILAKASEPRTLPEPVPLVSAGGQMPCGCSLEEFTTTGQHRPRCILGG